MSGPKLPHTRRAVELIREGWSNVQIAAELGMTDVAVGQLRHAWFPDTAVPVRKIDRNLIGQRDLAWVDSALCSQVDPELFFPEKGGSTAPGKRVCAQCPVTAECLAFALTRDLDYGTYGGLSDLERKRLRRTRGAA